MEGVVVRPDSLRPLRRQHRGARQSLCPARHQGGSSSVAILLVVERIMPLWQLRRRLLRL